MGDGHGAALRTALNRVRRRWLAVRWLRAIVRVVGGAGVGLLVVVAAEALLAPPDAPLLAVAGAVALATLAFAARVVWPLRRPPSDERVARFVEERCPELEDRVASAAALAGAGPSAGFRELVLADAAECLGGIDLARVVPPAGVRRAAGRGLAALALLAAVAALGSAPLGRLAAAAWLRAAPSAAHLVVDPGDFRLVAGQPLRVRVRSSGGNGFRGRTPPVLSVLDGGTPRDVRMRPAGGGGWLAEFPSVTRGFRYRVGAAGFTSRDYLVEALSPPRVTRIDVEYTYPAFTGLPPRVEEDGGDLFAPAGTVARLVVHTDEPVAEGALVLSGGRRVALADAGDGRRTAALAVEGDGGYAVRVVDAHGLSNRGAAGYVIRAVTDRPPAVRVLRPGGDREVTPLEEVTIEVRADDDHAVAGLDLVYAVAGREERVLPFDLPARRPAAAGVRTLFVEDLSVEPGDFITYHARVRDAGPAGVSTEARSDLYFLEVRPFDNAFEEAPGQGGPGPREAEIGRLAARQKQIVVATWRLDRRPEDRRAEDVRAVAEAQGSLRDTAAGAAGPSSGPATVGDADAEVRRRALAAAVEAMTAAETALAALDTASALPHENEALNHLLTARAAVRRRQVSRQAGRGAGGQAQLDLSALFDRELRREQETSYETARPPGAPPPGADEAPDRLEELARRQERINRGLRRAAETGAAAERRRRLERLRREQQALRAELEALAEQAGRQPGADGRSGADAADRAALREAVEQMRRAADGLGRQDGDAARGHGDRAAEALRRLAERLQDADGERRRLVAALETARRLRQRIEGASTDDVTGSAPGGASPGAAESSGDAASSGARSASSGDSRSSEDAEPRGDARSGAAASPGESASAERTASASPSGLSSGATDGRSRGYGGPSGPGAPPSDRPGGGGAGAAGDAARGAAGELAGHPGLLRALAEIDPGLAADLESWARQWRSRSAPGADPARLDFARWTSLRRGLVTALRRVEQDLSRALADRAVRNRYAAGTDDAVPERYRRLVERYYRSLAGAPPAVR